MYIGPAIVKGVRPGQQVDITVAQRPDVVEQVAFLAHPNDISMPRVGDTVLAILQDGGLGNFAFGVIYSTNYGVKAGERKILGAATSTVNWTFPGGSTSELHSH